MTILYLSDNSFVLKRGSDQEPIADDEGATPADGTITARMYLSASKAHNAAQIHESLNAAAVPIAAGKFRTIFAGSNVRTHITPLLDTAEQAGGKLTIYGHVVVSGSHHDVEELPVVRERIVP